MGMCFSCAVCRGELFLVLLGILLWVKVISNDLLLIFWVDLLIVFWNSFDLLTYGLNWP